MANTFLEFLKPYERELLKKGEKKRGIVITVSGMSGSGKSMVVEFILENLELRRFSAGQVFRELASRKDVSIEEFSKTRDKRVDHKLEKRILSEGLKGNVIVDGRLAGWALGKWANLRIFVTSPMKKRAERVAKRDKISKDEVVKMLHGRDLADKHRYSKIYGIDLNDMSIYHKVIDNSGSLDELKKQVLDAIKKCNL